MTKQFIIMGRDEMSYAIPMKGYLDKPFAVISITEPNFNFITFKASENRNCRAILALMFSDLNTEDMKGLEGDDRFKLITEGQAKAIAEFAKGVAEDIDIFAVNCDAGICRSSAIAAALAEYFNGTSDWIWNSDIYLPNQTVYNTVKEALGMETLRSYYKQLEGE